MNSSLLPASEFRQVVLNQIPILDVRAPVEFQAGAIPGSLNQPILNNEERAEIGTLYKAKGQEAAIQRGFELVSGSTKEERLQKWHKTLLAHPEMLITCFRGGKRSQIAQSWLAEAGLQRPRIDGGYKAFRQYLLTDLERLSQNRALLVISGATGSGKSLAIKEAIKFRPTVDLESYAHHRGSAFGGYGDEQPSQIDFENRLSAELIRIEAQKDPRHLVVEDESRLIGKCAQPESFFLSLRASPIVFIDEPLKSRVDVTYQEYILNSDLGQGSTEKGLVVFERFQKSLQSIARKLGGLQFAILEKDLQNAKEAFLSQNDLEPNRLWIEKLLKDYYDPMYFGSIKKRDPKVLFKGSRREVIEFLNASKAE
ncbi:MAG: tRNA 2-selenouridine(34) synthase MnmH [Pseudobdellovibrionaceae bacterium]